ncbi:M12 family metallo-peptidase, partial [Flavobacteriaceae bacterium]|nr:M12 family metallo-peptidase [Flavobacteriaceae bacterium]
MQLLLAQDRWTQVSNPGPLLNSLEVFGETFYKAPNGLLKISKKNATNEIRLPNEKGEEEIFLLSPAPVLSQSLKVKYPSLKTYKGVSKQRPNVRVRLSTQPSGINAWLELPTGPDFFIQPVKGKNQLHYTYTKSNTENASPLFCKTEAAVQKKAKEVSSYKNRMLSDSLRTFRIAVAGTGEYTAFWGDDDDSNGSNAEDALAAVVSTINRINVVFERDLNIRLELVSDINLLYEDSNKDPFVSDFSSELQETLDNVVGDEAYDVGHLFDFGEPDGDAGCIGCVCTSGQKGQGYSIHPFRDIYGGEYRNDYFDLDYAGHEIGHQFGAYHTFSHQTEGTGVNAEPGSGSTIMGYAGITGPDDLQEHGDAYFHFYSIKTISEFVATLSCGSAEAVAIEP